MHSKEALFHESVFENLNNRLFSIDAPLYSRWVLLSDLLVIPAIYGLCLLFFHEGFVVKQMFSFNLMILLLSHLGVYWMTGRYSVKGDIMNAGYLVEHAVVTCLSLLIVLFYLFGTQHFFSVGMMPMTGMSIASLIIGCTTWYMRREFYAITVTEESIKELIVLGTGEKAQKFFRTLQEKRPYKHVSFFSLEEESKRHLIEDDFSSPLIKRDLIKYLKKSRRPIRSIVLTEPGKDIPVEIMKQLVSAKFSHIDVKSLAQYHADKWYSYPEYDLSPFWQLEDHSLNADCLFCYGTLKRAADVLISGIALTLLSPLALVCGLAVRLESRGPALFKQQRVGEKGTLFTIYKFRSMTLGSEKGDVYTRKGDKRITRLGGFMRKTRLDEIPQLWNILKGDMSLIGPRPEWNILVERYEQEIDFYHFRHLVKPGLTGWAQVNYSYGANLQDTIEKLKYDLYYVQECSPKLDLMVVVKTIYTMLGFKGL